MNNIEINIYTINDFHGAILESNNHIGISKIGAFLIEKRKSNKNVLVLSAGDMLPGSYLSYLSKGEVMIRIINEINFDAMAIGNHEFDWGIKTLECNANKANFPILGANVYDENNNFPTYLKPYDIKILDNIKVGIIGVIGEDQYWDISHNIIKDYNFLNQFNTIKYYTKELRNKHHCDVIIVLSHSNTGNINNDISLLSGDEKVDVIINGHTHNYYQGEITRENSPPLPYIQSGNSGLFIGNISLLINSENKNIIDVKAKNLFAKANCFNSSKEIDNIIIDYQQRYNYNNEGFGLCGRNYNKDDILTWSVNVLRKTMNTDIGIINSGVIRENVLPLFENDIINNELIYQMIPFDNCIYTLSIKGNEIKNIFDKNYDGLIFDYIMDIKELDNDKYYLISVIDFIFEKPYYPFKNGYNIKQFNKLFRDCLIEEIKKSINKYGKWNLKE